MHYDGACTSFRAGQDSIAPSGLVDTIATLLAPERLFRGGAALVVEEPSGRRPASPSPGAGRHFVGWPGSVGHRQRYRPSPSRRKTSRHGKAGSQKILPRGFEPRTTACLSAAKRAVHRGNVPLDLYKHRVINQLDDGRRSSKRAAILLSSVGHRMTASSRGALSAHERPSRLTLAHGLRMRPPVLSRYAAPAWKEAHAQSSVCDPAASSRRCLVLRRSGRLS